MSLIWCIFASASIVSPLFYWCVQVISVLYVHSSLKDKQPRPEHRSFFYHYHPSHRICPLWCCTKHELVDHLPSCLGHWRRRSSATCTDHNVWYHVSGRVYHNMGLGYSVILPYGALSATQVSGCGCVFLRLCKLTTPKLVGKCK